MKRKWLSFVAAMLSVLFCVSYAQSGSSLSSRLFADAKKALVCLDAGDYEMASALLGCAEGADLQKFAEGNFSELGLGVQTKVSVAFWTGSYWNLAIPLQEPKEPAVETLVLTVGDDLNSFCGYRFDHWGRIEDSLAKCDYAVWNEEYQNLTYQIIAD